MAEPAGSGTQALDRAVQLTSMVVQADTPLSFADLQEATGLAKSTTSRLLAALERGDLLEREENGGYVAGSLFWLYAARHDPWEQLVRLARPAMQRIGRDTQESVHLSVLRGDHVVQVAQVDSQYLLGTRDWTQVDVPAHTSSLGKVFLAWLPADECAAVLPPVLERFTPHTIADRAALDRELEGVRRDGYASCLGEYEDYSNGVSAAVFDAGHRPVAIVNIWGPSLRVTRARLPALGRAALRAAHEMSLLLA